jgi:tripartite-type tricarboxylate transporter receptor subunit TctC
LNKFKYQGWVLMGLFFSASAFSQTHLLDSRYPSKVGRVVVAYPPGGPTDILGRLLAQKLTETLGQSFIVDNRPGAAGMIGAEMVAKSSPDGFTLLVVPATHAVNPSLYSKMTFDTMKDFTYIDIMAETPFILVVHPSLPVKNVADLVKLARQNPLNYAAASLGGLPHLAGELFNLMNHVKMLAIPYKGGGPATMDLLSGHVPLMFNSMLVSMPLVASGKLRPLGVTTIKRSAALPQVPTIAEQSMSGFDVSGWYAVMGPAGINKEVLQRLNTEINRGFQDPVVVKRLATEGVDAVTSTPAETTLRVSQEILKWGKVVKASSIKVE